MNDFIFNLGVLVLRVGFGGLMITHGVQKLRAILSGEADKWLDPVGIGAANSLYLAAFAELVCSVLVIAGLFTRVSSAMIAATMFVAAFVFLKGAPFAERELAILFLAGFAALAILGGGDFSVSGYSFGRDSFLRKL